MSKNLALVLSVVVAIGVVVAGVWLFRPKPPAVTIMNNANVVANGNTNQGKNTSTRAVAIYLIAIDDNGTSGKKVGCGDSVVPVNQTVTFLLASSDEITTESMTAALTALFSNHEQFVGQSGLYNALYQSRLQVDDVTIVDGQATVTLSGTLQLGGECDTPRVESQITDTVRQFPEVTSSVITLNGKLLSAALSLK